MNFSDRQITCLDCGQPFVFTAGEQQFYEKKGFREEPKRCKTCRDARKNRRAPQAGASSSGNGEIDDDIGNRAPPSSSRSEPPPRPEPPQMQARGPREVREVRGKRELFDAVCATCGAATRVPFRPAPGRPVYCRDCFGAKGVA
jgi:CxxC-x17-CxxC domain-containing protein